MSYYLGKVGRAGARLVSSCKDLYYDVNAAYLTGAIDVIVVRQSDGSLKSTPFHVRFGKLGVLRTGDLKEVEVEVNGTPVDVNMKVDETGRGFFVQPRTTPEAMSASHPLTGIGDSTGTLEHIALEIEELENSKLQVSKDQLKSHDHLSEEGGSLSKSHVTQAGQSLSLVEHQSPNTGLTVTESKPPWKSDPQSVSVSLPEAALMELKHSDQGASTSAMWEEEEECSLLEQRRSSAPVAVKRDTSLTPSGPSIRSTPIQIQRPSSQPHRGFEEPDHGSLPRELEVLSDSAVENERPREVTSESYGALSDTEVEVKGRLHKLWDWSRGRQTSKGEVSSTLETSISAEEMRRRRPQQASMDKAGFWGTVTSYLKRQKKHGITVEGGIYLDDLDDETMDPEEMSKFFPSVPTSESTALPDQLGSSGVGSSPSLSPSPSHTYLQQGSKETQKLVSTLEDVSLSLCGGLSQGNITDEAFQNSQVSFADFCSDPALLSNPNLVVRVAGKYYNWQVAAPMIISVVAYLKTLPDAAQSKLVKRYMPRKVQTRQSFWYFWGRSKDEDNVDGEVKAISEGGTPVGSPRQWMNDGKGGRKDSMSGEVLSSDDEQEAAKVARPRQRSLRRKKYSFTNQLTSEQLASLPLRPGPNEVVFSITTKFQGTTKTQCTLYLWDYSDKIVVSDIDGTITRSDVAGQLLPLFGKDWTQNGVVELFNAIHSNGYHIVYLSARAIGQAWYTKEFLRKLRRGPASLPDGPLFLAPFSLYIAFKKEVIERRPEDHKIECLKQIRALFPADYHPLHAGFGNKSSDVKSYVKVDIPRSRIFTVNHKGHLKYELSWTFQSSYLDLMGFVDAQFPPLLCATDSQDLTQQDIAEDYSTFNYWRDPLPVGLPFELPDSI